MANYYMMDDWEALSNKMNEIADTLGDCKNKSAKMKAELNEYLANFDMIVGTKKAEVCADVCRYCEQKGVTESWIIRPGVSEEMFTFAQQWYVYKEDGKWFQKMHSSCKAKHEVLL